MTAETTMTRMFDDCRRAASIVLVAVLLVLVPSVAMARFTSSKAPAALSVGTASMVTPSALTGHYSCTKSGRTETVTVTFTRFTDGGPTGSTYYYGVGLVATIYEIDSSTSTTAHVTVTASETDKGNTPWTAGIQTWRGNWSSDIATVSISCGSNGKGSGTF